MAVAFGKLVAFFAVCSAGQEASNASCASQDATSHLQVQSGGKETQKSKDSLSPLCFQQPCNVIKGLCISESKCCDLAKVCVPEGPGKVFQNPCEGSKPTDNPYFDNQECWEDGVVGGNKSTLEQSGINVTEGYLGGFDTSVPVPRTPILTSYAEAGLCPVNVHFHLGTEHYSVGQYDVPPGAQNDDVRHGFSCNYYDSTNPKFDDANYDWKYCKDVRVGETYEIHWPHSEAGACGTQWQYQSPFYDGVFCTPGIISLNPLNTWQKIGVQAQVFTIINDEDYYYPDLFKGMLVDSGEDLGQEIAYYTGSTTGTSRDNTICSKYTPITWQVDRKCHLISASSFDKMCKDMKAQKDDMSYDLKPHGSRELVDKPFAADNLQLLEEAEEFWKKQGVQQ